MAWEILKVDSDYEINTSYPYVIRRRATKAVAHYGKRQDGYLRCYLNQKEFLKHIVVAKQWLPNPKHYPMVDHRNRRRADDHLSNLRWVSVSDNNYNRNMPHHYNK